MLQDMHGPGGARRPDAGHRYGASEPRGGQWGRDSRGPGRGGYRPRPDPRSGPDPWRRPRGLGGSGPDLRDAGVRNSEWRGRGGYGGSRGETRRFGGWGREERQMDGRRLSWSGVLHAQSKLQVATHVVEVNVRAVVLSGGDVPKSGDVPNSGGLLFVRPPVEFRGPCDAKERVEFRAQLGDKRNRANKAVCVCGGGNSPVPCSLMVQAPTFSSPPIL
jgi:hypothetical protein